MEFQDYEYLINCHDILHTCQEALKENDLSVSSVILTNLSQYKDCMEEDDSVPTSLSSITSTTSSSSSSSSVNDAGTSCTGRNGASLNITDALSGKLGGQFQANSVIEFSLWLDRVEKQLDSVCHCPLIGKQSNVKNDVVANAEAIQKEVQGVGRRFISAIAPKGKNSSLFVKEETRWHSLWLKSLETLMIIENQKCPKHFAIRSEKKKKTTSDSCDQSSGYSAIGLTSSGTGPEGTPEISRAVLMRNRRIQTMMSGGYDSIVNEMKGSKFEIVQKDIGYSSDADMSDTCEPNLPRSNTCITLSSGVSTSGTGTTETQQQQQQRPKRFNKRRRSTRVIRRRPWSFHGALDGTATTEWIDEWDYYQPPSLIECKSSENVFDSSPFDDENTVRSLTEFGENYENWIKIAQSEDEFVRSSTPISSSCFDEDDVESGIASQGEKKKVYKKIFSSIGTDVCCPIQTESQGVQSDIAILPSSPPKSSASTNTPPPPTKAPSKKQSNMTIWITFSIITLFLSLFFAVSSNSPHIELTFPSNPPPI